jgi:hypothetical protein
VYRYPRLPASPATELVRQQAASPISTLRENASLDHPDAIYAPVGPTRAPEPHLQDIAGRVRAIAEEHGYPVDATQHQAADFDSKTASELYRQMQITPNEASHEGCWQFMACVMLPDVVRWRFPGKGGSRTSDERFLGGVRNVFGRLWWRACMLYDESSDDPYHLLGQLNEDELVQLMERPGMVGDRRLTQVLVKEFLRAIDKHDQGNRMTVMREAQKRLMRLFPLICFPALPSAELQEMVEEVVAEALSTQSTASRPTAQI